MSTAQIDSSEQASVVAAATAGNESAFSALVERYRRELHVHCYRMLASFDDAEDVVQETFLRAWTNRATFQARSSFRAWLYRIATNACLDFIARDTKRGIAEAPDDALRLTSEVTWLQPYPDRMLAEVASSGTALDVALVKKETIELAFLAAIQLLTPNARAVLILRDVLDWSAKETADLLETSVASVNSALQRARATLKTQLPAPAPEWVPGVDPSEAELALLKRYMEATETADADAFIQMLREDARFTMPPEPGAYVGREVIVQSWVDGGFGSESFGQMRGVATRANMQPAVAVYVRRPGMSEFRLFALDVLRIAEGRIADITTFSGELLVRAFKLPATL